MRISRSRGPSPKSSSRSWVSNVREGKKEGR
jgi:hypothetical protein